MALKLFNTLSGEKEEFDPLEPGKVKMYSCGPTVYDRFHIGNARPFILFDGLRRYLEFRGYDVDFTQNVTDIDDKIINRAREEGVTPGELAEKYTDAYFEDLDRLGVKKADQNPKITDHIPAVISFVEDLLEKGYAYEIDGDVYYRVSKFEDYGKLSGRSLEDLRSGSRVAVDESKEEPFDFALWKKSPEDEPGWDSPWGRGRPGWHIECSVMANVSLGDTIDIHAGGQDLTFPHHENEIAQSEARTGKTFARYWLHNGLLKFEGEKMSKSLGNFQYAREVVEEYGKETVRLFYFATHYRKPLDFSEKNLLDAKRGVQRVYELLDDLQSRDYESGSEGASEPTSAEGRSFEEYLQEVEAEFIQEVDDDFNTPGGLGVIFELVRETNRIKDALPGEDQYLLQSAMGTIRKLGRPLGLFQEDTLGDLGGREEDLLELLIEVREELREREEWELADKIRSELRALGVELKDQGEETTWVVRN